MTLWKAENLEERMMQCLLVTLLHSLKVESSSPQFLSQAPMTEPQHFFLKAKHILISLTSSKGRKWVYIMQVLTSRAMFLLLWQWQGLCCVWLWKPQLYLWAWNFMSLSKFVEIVFFWLATRITAADIYQTSILAIFFSAVVRVMTNVSFLMDNKIGWIEQWKIKSKASVVTKKHHSTEGKEIENLGSLRFVPLV